jgi:Flp pilus assembly pilin Flp
MTKCFVELCNDENGFVVSAELVLVATIGVLAMIVGLSEVAYAVNQELEDVGSAFGAINQSYSYNGTAGFKGQTSGSHFWDERDDGDMQCDIVCDIDPQGEATSW